MEKKLNKANLENTNTETVLNKIEHSLRPVEVFLIALPVLFLPLLYIQGQAYRESIVSALKLSQIRYSIDFHKSIVEGIRSVDFSLSVFFIILSTFGVVYFLALFLCDNKFFRRTIEKIRKKAQKFVSKTSKRCEKHISNIESILKFLVIVFFISFFFIIAMGHAGKKGHKAGSEFLAKLENNYSEQSNQKYFNQEQEVLAEGIELLCSEKWCAIYHEDKSITEVNLENGFIIKSNRLKLKE